MRGCEIVARRGGLLPLRSFGLIGCGTLSEDQLLIVDPDRLQCLDIDGSTDARCLLSSLIGHPLPRLFHLGVELTPTVATPLFVCLNSCPQLKTVEIKNRFIQSSVVVPHELPETTIPALESFLGSERVVHLFVSNRPVIDIELRNSALEPTASRIATALRDMSSTSVPLQTLHIEAHILCSYVLESFTVICSLFPELRHFSVMLGQMSYDAPAEGPSDASVEQQHPSEHLEIPVPAIELPGYMYGMCISHRRIFRLFIATLPGTSVVPLPRTSTD